VNDGEFREFFDQLPDGETQSVEWKSGRPFSDRAYRCKIVKAIIAMSNLADGGRVLLGPTDGQRSVIAWSDPADIDSWTMDGLGGVLRSYCSEAPRVVLRRRRVEGGDLLEISVSTFDALPTFCVKNSEGPAAGILYAGQIYVRAPGQASSAPAGSQADMRPVFDLHFARAYQRVQGLGVARETRVDLFAKRAKEFFET